MQTEKHLIYLLFLLSIFTKVFSQQYQTTYSGWGPLDFDKIKAGREYRIEFRNQSNQLEKINFFDKGNKFIKWHDFIYDVDGMLLKQLIYSKTEELKFFYYYDFDPIIKDWMMIKYSNRGQVLNSLYFQEIYFDSTLSDQSYYHGIPVKIR